MRLLRSYLNLPIIAQLIFSHVYSSVLYPWFQFWILRDINIGHFIRVLRRYLAEPYLVIEKLRGTAFKPIFTNFEA